MKTSATLLAIAAFLTAPAFASGSHGDPFRPVGSLDISEKMIRNGKRAYLSWNITYPVTVPDLLMVQPSGSVTTKEEVKLKLRVAGVAFQSGSTEIPVAFWTKVGGGSWQQLFYGTGNQVKPNEIVFEQTVPANTTIDFAGRGRTSTGSWYDVRWTMNDDVAVTGLVNGDTPPDYAPAYQQGDIESFLTGYFGHTNNGHGNNLDGVDSSNPGSSMEGLDSDPTVDDELKVTIGPRDMIYLFELASRDPGEWWFDMQDLVVIATYEPTGQ